METSTLTNEAVLTFVLRVILGILFFFQGYDKVVNIKINGVADFYRQELGAIKLPRFFLVLTAGFTSLAELICGVLLVLGLYKTYALYILGLDLILVVGAFSLIKPMWDMTLLFPRLILLSVLLYLPIEWDVLSADFIISKYF